MGSSTRVYQVLEGNRVLQGLLGLLALQGCLWVHIPLPFISYITDLYCLFTNLIFLCLVIFAIICQGKAGEDGKTGTPGKMVMHYSNLLLPVHISLIHSPWHSVIWYSSVHFIAIVLCTILILIIISQNMNLDIFLSFLFILFLISTQKSFPFSCEQCVLMKGSTDI